MEERCDYVRREVVCNAGSSGAAPACFAPSRLALNAAGVMAASHQHQANQPSSTWMQGLDWSRESGTLFAPSAWPAGMQSLTNIHLRRTRQSSRPRLNTKRPRHAAVPATMTFRPLHPAPPSIKTTRATAPQRSQDTRHPPSIGPDHLQIRRTTRISKPYPGPPARRPGSHVISHE